MALGRYTLQKTRMSHLPQRESGLEGSCIHYSLGIEAACSFSPLPLPSLYTPGRNSTGTILSLGLKNSLQQARVGQKLKFILVMNVKWDLRQIEYLFILPIRGVIHNSKEKAIPVHTGPSLVLSPGKK